MQVSRAEAIASFLSKKHPWFFDDNLLAGTTTSKRFGAPLYPELAGMTIWPELDTISTRKKNPMVISASDAQVLDLDIFPFGSTLAVPSTNTADITQFTEPAPFF